MPWSVDDANKHKKGLSSSQKSKWSSVANRILQQTGNEGKAVRVANGVTRRSVERRLRKPKGYS